MTQTYRAMQVNAAGKLEMVHRPVPMPVTGEVLIAVEACGICGADKSDIARADPDAGRVPGHEVVGRILAVGSSVPDIWTVGQRVGVGRLGGACGTCLHCRRGRFNLCSDQPVTGASRDGGYAEVMTARASGLVSIPEELASEEAAPILCAGIATFNGLRASGAVPGDTVAVLGIGGLGHMALQYARRMGFRTVAIGRGGDTGKLALRLGAHHYIDTDSSDAAEALGALGGAAAILSTIGDTDTVSRVLPGLSPEGRLVLLGIGADPLAVATGHLVGGQRGVVGSLTGTPADTERTLDFSLLTDARPMIETLPLAQAQAAFDRMATGDVKFRMVLKMETLHADQQ